MDRSGYPGLISGDVDEVRTCWREGLRMGGQPLCPYCALSPCCPTGPWPHAFQGGPVNTNGGSPKLYGQFRGQVEGQDLKETDSAKVLRQNRGIGTLVPLLRAGLPTVFPLFSHVRLAHPNGPLAKPERGEARRWRGRALESAAPPPCPESLGQGWGARGDLQHHQPHSARALLYY